MVRRCTQSACRREFQIGDSGPVQCPHCGHLYPRVVPVRQTFYGYGLEILSVWQREGSLRMILTETFPRMGDVFRRPQSLRGTFRLDASMTLTDVRALAGRLQRAGISARIIPTHRLGRTRYPVIRILR